MPSYVKRSLWAANRSRSTCQPPNNFSTTASQVEACVDRSQGTKALKAWVSYPASNVHRSMGRDRFPLRLITHQKLSSQVEPVKTVPNPMQKALEAWVQSTHPGADTRCLKSGCTLKGVECSTVVTSRGWVISLRSGCGEGSLHCAELTKVTQSPLPAYYLLFTLLQTSSLPSAFLQAPQEALVSSRNSSRTWRRCCSQYPPMACLASCVVSDLQEVVSWSHAEMHPLLGCPCWLGVSIWPAAPPRPAAARPDTLP